MKTLITLLCALSVLCATAQNKLKGKVADALTGESLPHAALTLTDTLQHKAMAFAEADATGNFEMDIPGNFTVGVVTVNYLGYATFTHTLNAKNVPETLTVKLTPINNELAEVIVNAKQQVVTINGDKMIFNIEKSGIGNGNNGLEAIRLIPGMRLDKDDNLLFRGSADVQIMINGKKSLLQGAALREYIRSLKGTDIQSVEVIAQPSARYDATGTTGIINIILKKNRAGGISGNVYSSEAYGEYFKNQDGAQLFYNDSLWNINANGYYYNGKSFNDRQVKQTIQLADGVRNLDQFNRWVPQTISKSINLGVERKLSEHHLMSTEWQYYKSDAKEDTHGTTYEYLNGNQVNEVKLTQFMAVPEERLTGNVFYNYTADSTATKLDVQVNYANYKTANKGFLRNAYADTSLMQLDGQNHTGYTIVTVQADLNQRLSKTMSMEAGVKYSDVDMNYFNRYTTNNASQLFIPDSLLVNDFVYKERLASGYAQLSVNLEKWSFLGGLRAEYYKYDATSKINSQTNGRSYTNWFPSLSVNYKKEDNQYQLSYSRRIGRPGYLALNPYYQYIDAYTLELGNPTLQPQLYHSFQLSYIYKSALNVSLYGYLYNKGFINVIDYLEAQNYNLTYQANASTGNRFGLSATMPYEPFTWWSMQLSLDAAYSNEKANVTNFSYSGSGFGYDLSLYENFNLKNNWNISLNGYYSGRSVTPNGYSKATYDFSTSVKKYLFDKKLQVLAGCSNILKKNLYNQVTQVDNVKTAWINKWETRRFYIQLTYYFGGGASKKVKSASLSEETNRI